MGKINIIIMVIIYGIIFLAILLLLDLLFKNTNQKKLKNNIFRLASKTNRPVIIFNSPNHGVVYDPTTSTVEEFDGYIDDILDNMQGNSAAVIVYGVLEYFDHDAINNMIEILKYVSGNDLYMININKKSPKIYYDYKIKNIFEKSTYLPNEKITWHSTNKFHKSSQYIYNFLFKILPYDYFVYEPIEL